MGLVALHPRAEIALARLPGALEFRAVASRAIARKECGIVPDAGGDEVLGGLLENRPPLFAVGLQQRVASPALQPGRELPAEIGSVLQAVVEAECAVGRMAVRRIPGDEHAPDLVPFGDSDAQVPEPHMVEFACEGATSGLLDEASKIKIVPRGIGGNGGMEKPSFSDVDAAEELPIALQVGMHDPVSRALRESLEALMKLT